MTAKTMAEVLAEHQDWTYLIARNAMVCAGRDCGWTKALTEDESSRDAYLSHQAAALSAAGFGLVADAKAEALCEAAEHFKQRSDTLHSTMLEMTGLPDFTAEDITRYGAYSAEANGTATWLRTKAAVIRNES